MIQAKKVKVHDVEMHYLIAGEGKPVLFLHGVPATSHMWRQIIPKVSTRGQCIAPDLIGMGQSDKPPIQYSIDDHIYYIEGFIDALGLSDITLVLHEWGSIAGLAYACKHPEKIVGIIFVESYLLVVKNFQDAPLPFLEIRSLFENEPEKLEHMFFNENYMFETVLPKMVLKKLPDELLAHYHEHFKDPRNRQALWQCLLENPFINPKSPVIPILEEYSEWLKHTKIRKLLLYALPGLLITRPTVKWAVRHFQNLTTVELGYGIHCLTETRPDEIAEAIASWL